MCTSIRMIAEDQGTVWGRTQDFMMPFGGKTKVPGQTPYNAYVGLDVPVGYVLEKTESPIVFKHQVIGVGIEGQPYDDDRFFFVDGLNDAGVTGGMLYFSDYAQYGQADAIRAAGKQPVRCLEFVTWILANCQSVADILIKISTEVGISDSLNTKGEADPLHFMFTDVTGRSIVLEPMAGDGSFKVFENTVGVMTNSPTFDWHMTNLESYAGLTNGVVADKIMGNQTLIPNVGNSSGLIGLPGDYTSRSRFVRAATLLSHSLAVATSVEARDSLFHVFNSLDSATGFQDMGDERYHFSTQYTVVYDLAAKELFLSVAENRRLQKLTMTEGSQTLLRYTIDYDQDIKPMMIR